MNAVVNTSTTIIPDERWSNIKPEVVDHYELALTHMWAKTGSVGANVFRDRGKDRFRTYMYGPIPNQYNDELGHYEIRGLELNGTLSPAESLEVFAGTTWLKVEARGTNGLKQENMPYTPKFQAQAGCSWKFMDNFKLYVDMQHIRDFYQGTTFRTAGFDLATLTPVDKLHDITLCNAKLSYGFDERTPRLKDSEVYFAVNNIFDQDYEYAKGYPMPGVTFFVGLNLKFH
ncbi:MAG: Vitamin B12 transporter BtuB [Deltaproteobacteria bacterium ADurb.Bin510]|nr:MAG: Vitamin B12 transporter BtuB [Deltaproteobacteria bacterium ADurb.Bin510]